MKNIFKLLNVKNESEFNALIESLNLDVNQYIDFMNVLSENSSESYIKEQLLEKTQWYGNGSYEKLKEQFSKKPFKRELKENNNVLPSGTYNIIVSNIEVDDYEEGEYNIHGEKELIINHDINNDLDEEIKEAILEDMGEPINGSIEVINYDYQIVDKNNKENLEEETIYDHSWYEVKKQKYPKRTKNGVEGLPIKESKNENNDEIERIHNEYLENKLNAFQAIEDLYIYTNFSTKEINEILYKWLEEKEKIKSDKVEIKEGIKDWFKKDNKQYRIMYGRNGGWISKDMKYIKGDIMDALIVTGYKKAQKLCDKLESKQKNEKGLLHIEEIKHYPEEKDFIKTYEFLDIMDKLKNREMTVEEIKKYLKDNKIHTNIDHYLMLYKPSKIKKEKEINENYSNESEYKVGQKLMYKKNGTTYVIDKVKGKYYDIKDSYSNKVYPVYKNTLDSEFKLLKEALEDEEVRDDTTEVKEPKQKSSADPEITKFISTTSSVVDNTTNADILKGIVDSINMKLAMVTDIEQSNQLGELKQKAETKLVSAKNIKTINESFHQDGRCDAQDIKIISYVRDNFTPYIKSVGDVDIDDGNVDVLVADKKSSFAAWMYASLYEGELDIDWNQDIFHMDNRDDRQRYYIQNEVGDVAGECVEYFLLEKNYIRSTDDGYAWGEEWTDDPEDDGSEWLDESAQGYVTVNNDEISIPVKVHDIEWDYGNEYDYDSQEEYFNTRDNLPNTTFIERYSLSKDEVLNALLGESDDEIISTIMELLEMEVEYTLHNNYNWSTNSWDMTLMSPSQRIIDIVKKWKEEAEKDNIEPESSGEEFNESYLSESNKDNSWLDNAKFQIDQKLVDSDGDIWFIDNIMYYKPDGQYSYSLTNIKNPEYMLLYKEDELMKDFTLYNEEPELTGEEFDESYDPSNDEPIFEIGDKVQFKWGKETYRGKVVKINKVTSNDYYDVSVWNSEKERVETFTRVDPISNEMKRIVEEMDETCSAGATGVANVSNFAKGFGKVAKRKKATESFDVKLFKESIINDMPCVTNANNHILRYFENNGKFYMGIDNALVKTFDKNVMLEAVDSVIYNELDNIELLEDYSCYEMDILMENE